MSELVTGHYLSHPCCFIPLSHSYVGFCLTCLHFTSLYDGPHWHWWSQFDKIISNLQMTNYFSRYINNTCNDQTWTILKNVQRSEYRNCVWNKQFLMLFHIGVLCPYRKELQQNVTLSWKHKNALANFSFDFTDIWTAYVM